MNAHQRDDRSADDQRGERKVLLTGGVYGLYVTTGISFSRWAKQSALPFDLDRLEVRGAPVAVVDDVAMNLTDGAAAFDVSENGTLACFAGRVVNR